MTKDFLWRLKLHAGNWNERPLVLSTCFSVLSGGRSGEVELGTKLSIKLRIIYFKCTIIVTKKKNTVTLAHKMMHWR